MIDTLDWEAIQPHLAKTLTVVRVDPLANDENGALLFEVGGKRFMLFDDGQSCCENRWLHTDDDLPSFVGAKFVGFDCSPGPTEDDEDGCTGTKGSMFVHLHTDRGTITMVAYNHHNGYYGGFNAELSEGWTI